jgi:hypothetical protein
MSTHHINGHVIHTSQPNPYDVNDWYAVDDNYDADCDQDGYFSTSPRGNGRTEQEAIDDLLEQLEDGE